MAGADSGIYRCDAEYPDVTDAYIGRQTKSLKVRGKTADATKYAAVGTASVTLSCEFFGDETTAARWYKGSSATALEEVEDKLKVTPGAYISTSNSLTTTLQILNVVVSDEAAYSCKTTYTDDSVETTSTQTLAVLAIRKLNVSCLLFVT